jgi:hypothetical protein
VEEALEAKRAGKRRPPPAQGERSSVRARHNPNSFGDASSSSSSSSCSGGGGGGDKMVAWYRTVSGNDALICAVAEGNLVQVLKLVNDHKVQKEDSGRGDVCCACSSRHARYLVFLCFPFSCVCTNWYGGSLTLNRGGW